MLTFEVLGNPQGKARARVTKWGAYTPDKTVLYENLIKMSFQQKYRNFKPSDDVFYDIEIIANFEIPKSYTKKKVAMILNHELKPKIKDIDNIIKIVLDALNGYLYKDDRQVIKVTGEKRYTQGDAKVVVNIKEHEY